MILLQQTLRAAAILLFITELCKCSNECDSKTDCNSEVHHLKLEAIKRQILSKLHLDERPNITFPFAREVALEALRRSHGMIPEDTLSENGSLEETAKDDYYARPKEILAFAEPGQSLNGHYLLDFYPREYLNAKVRVTAATLWIQMRYSSSLSAEARLASRDQRVTLYAFRVGNSTEQLSHVTSYHQGTAHAGWRRLDVGEVVTSWLSGAEGSIDKLTLLVDCAGCNNRLEMVLFNDQDPVLFESRQHELINVRPFLAIATEPLETRRSRRHSRNCNAHSTHCCRQNLYVNFRELGWGDWIIAPRGYHANYCTGSCEGGPTRRRGHHRNFHSHILEEYKNRNPYASVHPCCAPTRLSAMSLIYFDTDLNIVKTDLPKMTVNECGCT